VRIDDPETNQAFVLIRVDLYERVRNVIERRSSEELHVPEGIRKSQEAFFRDLPEPLRPHRSPEKQRSCAHRRGGVLY